MWDDFDFERRLRSPVDAEERFAAFFTVAFLATFFVDFFGGIVSVEVRGARRGIRATKTLWPRAVRAENLHKNRSHHPRGGGLLGALSTSAFEAAFNRCSGAPISGRAGAPVR